MTLIVSIAFAAVGSIVTGVALREIFNLIDPGKVSQYRTCAGGWWEAELNQCGTGLGMVPQQPVNTYTNVLYLTGGLFLAFYLNTLASYVFFITSFYLCTGSALYHSTSTRWGGSLDVSAMYAVFSALTIYAASLHFNLEDSAVALIMFVVAVLAGYLLRYKYKGNMSLKIGIFLVLTYFLVGWSLLNNNRSLLDGYLVTSFALFAVAYGIWNLDKIRIFPIKRWGHGLWHILTAVAISMLFYTIYLIS